MKSLRKMAFSGGPMRDSKQTVVYFQAFSTKARRGAGAGVTFTTCSSVSRGRREHCSERDLQLEQGILPSHYYVPIRTERALHQHAISEAAGQWGIASDLPSCAFGYKSRIGARPSACRRFPLASFRPLSSFVRLGIL